MHRHNNEIGAAHLKKSKKVRFARIAIITPIGFPTAVALLPMLVAKTIMSKKGIGLTL